MNHGEKEDGNDGDYFGLWADRASSSGASAEEVSNGDHEDPAGALPVEGTLSRCLEELLRAGGRVRAAAPEKGSAGIQPGSSESESLNG